LTIDNLTTSNPDIVIGSNSEITVTINNSDGFDETPPAVDTFEVLNDSTFILTFTEQVDPVTSQLVTNYVVNNAVGNPDNALLGYIGDSTKVELSFPAALQPGAYQLTINNVEDLKSNVIAANTIVNFSISSGPGSGWIEDFELANWGSYSTGTFTLSTGDWDILDVYPETSAAYAYEGSHAVRMNDDSANSSVTAPAVNGVDSVIFFYRTLNQEGSASTFWLQKSVGGGAFTNVVSQTFQNNSYAQFAYKVNDSSDNIRIRVLNNNQAGHLIVDYFKVVTFSGPVQDTTAPDILSHVVTDSTLIITFSEPLDPITSQTITNYVLGNGGGNPSAAVLGYGGDSSVVEVFYPSFLTDTNYQLTINNVEDTAGNPMVTDYIDFIISSGGGSGEGWVEDFELANWGSYSSGTFALTTGNWDIVDVYPETSAAYAYEGSHAVRMNDDSPGSSVTSPAVNGVDSVIFYFRALNQEASVSTFWLQKSVGGGAYTNVQSQTFQNSTYSQFACKVNDASDNIRLRVLNDDQSGHLIIDNFAVVQFPAAQPPSAPDNVSTAISGTDITITWDAVSGASGYDVYSSDLPYTGFGWEAAVTTPEYSTSCTEANKFYYIVASTTAKALNPGESHERFIEIRKKSK
ncbi:MAG: Ig-like domain-containing protein, partial [Candidatus Delongbacteria bacterium]